MRYIFLDIDGVLNGHECFENGYCGIRSDCAGRFNQILTACPNMEVIISSAWRYMVHTMDESGFESLLLTHGLNIRERIGGFCRHDHSPDEPRINIIKDWMAENDPECEDWIAIDDLFLSDDTRCIKIDGTTGLTDDDVIRILAIRESIK